jgi:predicted dehydrogenase
MQKADGMFYAPKGKAAPVCEPGEFPAAAMGLDHGHIYGMANGLLEAGAELRWVWDPDPAKVERFRAAFPGVKAAKSEAQVLEDSSLRLVASACVPSERAKLGVRVLEHGKHYFADKPPLTSLKQLEEARRAVSATGRKYMVYYAERLHSESAVKAGRLIEEGAVGRVLQVIGLGPHRINLPSRPDWFFKREKYGGIICDIGSHQIEQFLSFSGARDAEVLAAKVANYNHKDYPELEDFGDATLLADNGATCYFRVDWFTPAGLGAWGDGRTFILGTEGYMELRKYLDVGRDNEGDQLYLVDHEGEKHIRTAGTTGFPFFGRLIRDCLDGTEAAMTQEHAFKAAELALKAQLAARRVE